MGIAITVISISTVLLLCFTSKAKTFKIASYNVENLFDLTRDGAEYTAYIPNTCYGWSKDIFDTKITNISKVIKGLNADIIALQEVESERALLALRKKLKEFGLYYPWLDLADAKATAVKCAVLSKFPIIKKEEIQVDSEFARNILKIKVDIDGRCLIIFINHWKSKRGPESLRILYAEALVKEVEKLNENADFVLIGDFNSNYNEYRTFRNSRRLNDTFGVTGINHVLRTVIDSKLVTERILTRQPDNTYLYNLWLEIRKKSRWSTIFWKYKNSPDNIIVSKGLYDEKGISYLDNSFNKFAPAYLFKEKRVYRWQRGKKGKGRHLGRGYSDHLPVFAYFSTKPFKELGKK